MMHSTERDSLRWTVTDPELYKGGIDAISTLSMKKEGRKEHMSPAHP